MYEVHGLTDNGKEKPVRQWPWLNKNDTGGRAGKASLTPPSPAPRSFTGSPLPANSPSPQRMLPHPPTQIQSQVQMRKKDGGNT